jgi:hypothetical protein
LLGRPKPMAVINVLMLSTMRMGAGGGRDEEEWEEEVDVIDADVVRLRWINTDADAVEPAPPGKIVHLTLSQFFSCCLFLANTKRLSKLATSTDRRQWVVTI